MATPSVVRPPSVARYDDRTYSSADIDVAPPIVSETMLASLRTSGLPGTTNTLELLVTADGLVDEVRLLSPPRQLADMLVLAAAKTWRLEPATRDGRPVAYRLIVYWTSDR